MTAAQETVPASTLEVGGSLPNVVLLYTDDQGYGDCAAFNPHCGFATPHLDRLATEGMCFTDAHSAGSVCTPSRYALLTGQYPWRTKVGGAVLGADAPCMIEAGRMTIPSLLRDRGYVTAMVGKWHLGMQIPGRIGDRDWSQPVLDGPLQKGFDHFFGIPASMNYGVLTWFDGAYATEAASMWTRKKFPPAQIKTAPLHYRMAPPYDEKRQGKKDIEVAASFVDEQALRIIAERSVAFIEAQAASEARRPFFLYVALTSPHLPHCTAEEFRGVSKVGNYGDFMVETDHRIGQILGALDASDQARNTLVIMSSDNGAENNRKDWRELYSHDCSGGFRGGKRDLYEGGHRVPFIVRWPGVVKAGSSSAQPVGQVDVLATLAEIVAQPLARQPPSNRAQAEDSQSLLGLLQGRGAQPRRPLLQYAKQRFAIRSGPWKLIFAKEQKGQERPGSAAELYNLDSDPGESRNLLEDHPLLVEDLSRQARDLIARG